MKIFSKKSRFSNGILWILLIVSITGVYFTMHNHLTGAQVKTPIPAILFTMSSIVITIILYQQFASILSNLNKSISQLDQLKKSIQESKKKEEIEDEVVDTETSKEENIEDETKSYFEQLDMDTEELFVEKLLSKLANKNDIVQAIAFRKNQESQVFSMLTSYAYFSDNQPPSFTEGDTLPGQVAKNKLTLNLKEVPENYINVVSGLGQGTPQNLLIVPMINAENECIGILEFASFKPFSDTKVMLFESIALMASELLLKIGNSTKN